MRKKSSKPPLTILLVDDDPLIRILGQELLEHLGYRVVTAADGSEALEKFQKWGWWTWCSWIIICLGKAAAR
jgi:CheY-like chemotaxis protein